VGIRAIEYRPWEGDRTNPNQRWTTIAKQVFLKNVKAKAVIILLIFGLMLAHAFPIIGAILIPHEDITNEDMVGSDEEDEPDYTINVTEGDVNITGDIRVNGTFHINGTITLNYIYLPLEDNETEEERIKRQEDLNRSLGSGLLSINGTLFGLGTISGKGGFSSYFGFLYTDNITVVDGNLQVGQLPDIPMNFTDNTTGNGDPPPSSPGEIEDLLEILNLLQFATTLTGDVNITGNGTISGNGTVEGWLEAEIFGSIPDDLYLKGSARVTPGNEVEVRLRPAD